MATSTIKKQFLDYVVVAESGSTSATVASKLATLRTAVTSLSSEQKHKAFIMVGNGIYNIQNVSSYQFANDTASSDRLNIGCIGLTSTPFFYEYIFKTSGTTINNLTENTGTTNYQLCYWI